MRSQLLSVQQYEFELLEWRQHKEEDLRQVDGWLSLAGLFWLHDGDNTLGSDPTSEILFPAGSTPDHVGVIHFQNNVATLHVTTSEQVLVNDKPTTEAVLQDDSNDDKASIVSIRGISFFVIKRNTSFGIRVRDRNNPALQAFTGRQWYDIKPEFRLQGKYTSYAEPRMLSVITSAGTLDPTTNPGYVDFTFQDQVLRLEAFTTSTPQELFFVIHDQTSGKETYGAGRFLLATMDGDGTVDLDFNRAYSPPCAFTHFATCPRPPKENYLPVRIEAGEKH